VQLAYRAILAAFWPDRRAPAVCREFLTLRAENRYRVSVSARTGLETDTRCRFSVQTVAATV